MKDNTMQISCHFKKAFLLCAAVMLAVAGARAELIVQTQNFSNIGNTGLALTWNKFDLNLGSLTAITLQATGVLSGSYTATNSGLEEDVTLTANTTGRIRLSFSGTGAPATLNGSSLNPLLTSPASTASTIIPPATVETFTLQSGAGINESSFFSNQFVNASYYSVIGGGTFTNTISRPVFVALSGEPGTFNSDTALLLANGTVELTYEYTPTEAVPEPGTWAAAALLVGGAAFMRWRKRRDEAQKEAA